MTNSQSTSRPLISIVTVTFNAEKTLVKTLESVRKQTFRSFEHIIIDGKSTDQTLGIIRKYKNQISSVISEVDKGIYDAMNKGLNQAKGEWIIFLNAGDYFHANNILQDISEKLDASFDVLYSDVISDYGSFQKILVAPAANTLERSLKLGSAICHNATFFRTEMHKKYPYNITFKISADYDTFLTMISYGVKFYKYPQAISTIETGSGVSYLRQVKTLIEYREIMLAHQLPLISLLSNTVDIIMASFKTLIKKCAPKTIVDAIIKLK